MNQTDRVLVTINGTPFGMPEETFSKVFPKAEGEEIVGLFKAVDELLPDKAGTKVKLQYMTNKEYLVLVQFGLTLNGPEQAFNIDMIKTSFEQLKAKQSKKEH